MSLPPLRAPREAHQLMREAIAPCLSMYNSAADVAAFIVVAVGAGTYELRTDLQPDVARQWLLLLAAEIEEDL